MDLWSLPPRGTPGTPSTPSGAAERAVMAGAAAAGILAWIIGGVLLTRRSEGLPPDGFSGLNLNAAIATTVAGAATAGAIAGLGVAVLRGGDAFPRRPRALLLGITWGLVVSAPLLFFALLAGTLLGPAVGGLLCIAAPLYGMRTGVRMAHRSADGELGAVPLRDLPPVAPGPSRLIRWGGRPRGPAR